MLRPRPACCRPCSIGRGWRDEWYTAGKIEADLQVLRAAGVDVTVCEFDGGHEWTEPFVVAASAWLAQRLAELS